MSSANTGKNFIFTMSGMTKAYPGNKVVLRDVHLSYYYGAKIGIIGMNGQGKSTILRIMAGIDQDFSGTAKISDGFSSGYLSQDPILEAGKTVKETVMEGMGEIVTVLKRFEEIGTLLCDPDLDPDKMEKLLNEQADLQEKIEAQNGWEIDHQLEIAMDALRCPPSDWKVDNLSGGEKRRVALCKLLLQKPDLLLLDEPTNHLDAESVAWLENFLKNYAGTVVLVTHDRYFLDNVTEWILEIDRTKCVPWKGSYGEWLEQKEKQLSDEESQDDKKKKLIARELEWVRMAPKARQAKSKARLNAYEKLVSDDKPERMQELQIYIPPGPRLGNLVIEGNTLTKAFGEKLLFQNFSFNIPPASIVGVIGPNGAGKSTLFKILTNQEKPDSGSIRLGETVKIAHVDQMRESLDRSKSVYDNISGGSEVVMLGNREVNARAYLARFNFSGGDQQKTVGVLSGGEMNRLQLAQVLKTGANVLLLDEPTNDLDIQTLRALEDALEAYAGCAMIISHDRWFLDRICTHIMAFEGDSNVVLFEGNFKDYEEDKVRRLGPESIKPKRIKFKKLA